MPPQSEVPTPGHRLLIILLRVVGVLSCTAIVATVMPTSWIVATNDWLGLGAFPDAPITQYLARSISALYAVFGALLIIVSTDVRRYAPIISFFAYACLVFGAVLTCIDALIGMPRRWTLLEGPSTFVLGVVILLLVRRVDGSNSTRNAATEQ